MIRPTLGASAAALALLAFAACDRGDGLLFIEPEIDDTAGFESGLGAWSPASSDAATSAWAVGTTSAASSAGSSSVRILFLGIEPGAKVWLERGFAVDSLRAYDVTVEYDLGTTETAAEAAWELVAGGSGSVLAGADMSVRGSTEGGPDPVTWVDRSHTFTATSGADGTLRVGLGIGSTTGGERTYYLDEVRVTLTRRN